MCLTNAQDGRSLFGYDSVNYKIICHFSNVTQPADNPRHVFISYCRVDRDWVERIRQVMAPLLRQAGNTIELWDDGQIQPGDRWLEAIESALSRANVALLLVSAEFLASEFVMRKEVPALLRAAKADGVTILWVPLSACLVHHTPIHAYQAVLPPDETIDGMGPAQQRLALVRIAETVHGALSQGEPRRSHHIHPVDNMNESHMSNSIAQLGDARPDEKDNHSRVTSTPGTANTDSYSNTSASENKAYRRVDSLDPSALFDTTKMAYTVAPFIKHGFGLEAPLNTRPNASLVLIKILPGIAAALLTLSGIAALLQKREQPAAITPKSEEEVLALCRSVQTIRKPKPDEFPEYKDLKDGLARFPPSPDHAYGQDVWSEYKCYEKPSIYDW